MANSGKAVVTLPSDTERIARTEVYEGVPDAEAVSTVTFTEKDGRTIAELLVRHTSKQNRDMHLNSGMEAGLQEAWDHLEQVARSLR